MSNTEAFTRKLNPDGTPNVKYVDLLDEDKPIAGQKFVCMSFISPEKILKQKEMFMFEAFLKHFELDKATKKFIQFLNFISHRYDLDFNEIMELFKKFTAEEKGKLCDTTIEDDYRSFLDNNEERLESEFTSMHNFQTSTRGIKVRGSFPTQEEAELRCKLLREVDPNHDVFVGPVGMWVPFHPEAYRTGRVEYLEEELNQLMNEREKNTAHAKQEFDERVRDAKRKAIKDNIKLAKETGNKLTQNIDENDQLVGVAGASTVESSVEGLEEITSANIRREIFESENVRMKGQDKNIKK